MTQAPGEAILRIDSIAAGGDGVARHDGLVVFVPRSAPGDVARVRVQSRGRFARGDMVELLEPGPGRVEPPCPHYGDDRCGGCQLQHLGPDDQRAAKARIISDALERIGRRRVVPPPVHPAPRAWRYRRKLTFAMRRERDGAWMAGLHPYNAPDRVFDVRDCPITSDDVLAVWTEVRRHADLLPRARALRASVRMVDQPATAHPAEGVVDGSASTPCAAFVVAGGRAWPESERFFTRMPMLTALWWAPEGQPRRQLHARGSAPPGASFAQVNPPVAAALRAQVLAVVRPFAPATVVDAYAGLGDLAAQFGAQGVVVTAIEADEDAAAWCGRRLAPPSRSIAGRVEAHLADVLPADVVVLNPPRTGVDASVTRVLEEVVTPPRAVVYVSCNPATLARDLARMPRYDVAMVHAFDMFPQTSHVETVCLLVPSGASR